jgi:hypothetical protein
MTDMSLKPAYDIQKGSGFKRYCGRAQAPNSVSGSVPRFRPGKLIKAPMEEERESSRKRQT